MSQCKLILIEGVPGSGKSTAAGKIHQYLSELGVENQFFPEGDPDNPADFEGVARLEPDRYANFLEKHPQQGALLEANKQARGRDIRIEYRKLERDYPGRLPETLLAELRHYDIYDALSKETYQRLALERWRDFAGDRGDRQGVTILECCFLQNPLTVLLARHNAPYQTANAYIKRLAEVIRPLHPLVLYLNTDDVAKALRQVEGERPGEWREFVIHYLTRQGMGHARGWQGYEGVIAFYELRKSLELGLLPELGLAYQRIEHRQDDWEGDWRQIEARLAEEFPAGG